MTDRESRVRQRAYELWEAEGRPEGREREHWEEACRQIDATEQPASDVGAKGVISDESGAQFGEDPATPSAEQLQQQSQQRPTPARGGKNPSRQRGA